MPAMHVLVATVGTTPQILTEAIYYHAVHRKIVFAEIHAITTAPGRERLRETLLAPASHPGSLAKLLRHLRIPAGGLAFTDRHIHVLRSSSGEELDDIRTHAESEAVADQMLDLVSRFCRDDDTTVHATLAGGRKTMGAYLHSMLQLVSRPQDRLFHILVHPLIETAIASGRLRDYYFPAGELKFGRTRLAPVAQLDYVHVPLLHWPQRERQAAREHRLSYRALVEQRQSELERLIAPGPLVIDCQARTVVAGGVPVALTREQFFWYAAIARLAASGTGSLPVADLARAMAVDRRTGHVAVRDDAADRVRLSAHLDALRRLFLALFPGHDEEWAQKMRVALTVKDSGLTATYSRINSRLRRALGDAAEAYKVKAQRHHGTYALLLPPASIVFRDPVTREL